MKIKDDFSNWVSTFEHSRRGRGALKLFYERFPSETDTGQVRLFGDSLLSRVLSSCYSAAGFDPAEDPGTRLRNANRVAREALPEQRRAIATLRDFIKTHHMAAALTFLHAMADLREKGIEITRPGTDWSSLDCLDNILGIWSAQLIERKPHAAVWVHDERNTYGCFLYPKPLDIGKRKVPTKPEEKPPDGVPHSNLPGVLTMLLFDLVQTFRFQSEGRRRTLYTFEPMRKGKPHYDVAAAFVNATLPEQRAITRKAAQSHLEGFLRRNRDTVRYYPWPIARSILDVTLLEKAED